MSNRFSKPVAFNRTKKQDQLILDHVKKRNFSGYVKKLILADIKKVGDKPDRISQIQAQLKKTGK